MARLARDAGFSEPVLDTVVSRLTMNPEPTYEFDEAATAEVQERAAAEIETTYRESAVGQVIFKRGDVLDPSELDLYRRELEAFQAQPDDAGRSGSATSAWSRRRPVRWPRRGISSS